MVTGNRNIFILILFSLITRHHCESTDLTRNIIGRFCPYTDLCQQNASAVQGDPRQYEPCCSKCSCSEDCWETNSCCPDKANTKSTDFACKSPVVKTGKREIPIYYVFRGYYIIDKCPYSEKDENIRRACSKELVNSLEDLIWVSDTASGKIYQNLHCASCNNISTWRMWNIRTDCETVLDANFANLSDVIFTGVCEIINEPPDDEHIIADNFKCLIPSISVCNQTGLWRQYDEDIALACAKYNFSFVESRVFSRYMIVYKNPFCYVCNKDNQFTADTLCPTWEGGRHSDVSFNALIDFTKIQEEPAPVSKCLPDEMYDKYMGRCRRLTCLFGSAPFNGECKALAQDVNNLGIIMGLRLKMILDTPALPQQPNVSSEDSKKIIKTVRRFLGFKKCYECRQILYMIKNTQRRMLAADFILTMIFLTNAECNLDYFLNNIAKLKNKSIAVHLDKQRRLTLSGHIESRPVVIYSLPNVSVPLAVISNINNKCTIQFELRMFPCVYIVLHYEEILSHTNVKVKTSLASLFDKVDNLDNTTNIFVCVKDYLNLMSAVMAESGSTVEVSFSALVFTLCCSLHLFSLAK